MYPLTCFMLCADDLLPSIFLKEGPQVIRFAMLQKTFDKESGQGTERVLDTRPAWTSSMRGSQRQGGEGADHSILNFERVSSKPITQD